ncbi:hypothetical protein ACSQ67_020737 [Phaseolus vulgaris]
MHTNPSSLFLHTFIVTKPYSRVRHRHLRTRIQHILPPMTNPIACEVAKKQLKQVITYSILCLLTNPNAFCLLTNSSGLSLLTNPSALSPPHVYPHETPHKDSKQSVANDQRYSLRRSNYAFDVKRSDLKIAKEQLKLVITDSALSLHTNPSTFCLLTNRNTLSTPHVYCHETLLSRPTSPPPHKDSTQSDASDQPYRLRSSNYAFDVKRPDMKAAKEQLKQVITYSFLLTNPNAFAFSRTLALYASTRTLALSSFIRLLSQNTTLASAITTFAQGFNTISCRKLSRIALSSSTRTLALSRLLTNPSTTRLHTFIVTKPYSRVRHRHLRTRTQHNRLPVTNPIAFSSSNYTFDVKRPDLKLFLPPHVYSHKTLVSRPPTLPLHKDSTQSTANDQPYRLRSSNYASDVKKPDLKVAKEQLKQVITDSALCLHTNPSTFCLLTNPSTICLHTFIVTKPYSHVRHRHLRTRIQHNRLQVTNPIAFEVAKEQLKQVITYNTLCLLTNPNAFRLLTNPSAVRLHTNPSAVRLHTLIVTKPYSRVRHRHFLTRIQKIQLSVTNPIAFKSSNYAFDVRRSDLKLSRIALSASTRTLALSRLLTNPSTLSPPHVYCHETLLSRSPSPPLHKDSTQSVAGDKPYRLRSSNYAFDVKSELSRIALSASSRTLVLYTFSRTLALTRLHTNPNVLCLHTFMVTKPYSRVRHRHLRTRIQHNQLPLTNPIAFKSSNYASDVKMLDLKVIKCSRVAKEQLKQVITDSALCLLTNPSSLYLLTNLSADRLHTNHNVLCLHTFIVTKPYSRVRHRHLCTRIQHNQLPVTNPIAFKSSNYASDVKRLDLKVIECSRRSRLLTNPSALCLHSNPIALCLLTNPSVLCLYTNPSALCIHTFIVGNPTLAFVIATYAQGFNTISAGDQPYRLRSSNYASDVKRLDLKVIECSRVLL